MQVSNSDSRCIGSVSRSSFTRMCDDNDLGDKTRKFSLKTEQILNFERTL